MSLALPKSRTAKNAILTLMESITAPVFDVFDGNVDEKEITIASDGKVQGYAVLWWTPGNDVVQRLAARADMKALVWQITAVGGDTNRCLGVADALQEALIGVRLTLPDGSSTPIRNYEFGNADVVQKDDNAIPERYYVPLQYSCRLA